MLEYFSVHCLVPIAGVWVAEFQRLSGVGDPRRYYTLASIAEDLINTSYATTVTFPHYALLPGTLRIEVAPYAVNSRSLIFPGETIEYNGSYSWHRIYFLVSALATHLCWKTIFSHFTLEYGSYTLYAHCG